MTFLCVIAGNGVFAKSSLASRRASTWRTLFQLGVDMTALQTPACPATDNTCSRDKPPLYEVDSPLDGSPSRSPRATLPQASIWRAIRWSCKLFKLGELRYSAFAARHEVPCGNRVSHYGTHAGFSTDDVLRHSLRHLRMVRMKLLVDGPEILLVVSRPVFR